MKKHAIHTTKGGDKFLRTHIVNSTPWASESYRPPTHPLPCEKANGYLVTMLATLAGVLGVMAAVSYFNK